MSKEELAAEIAALRELLTVIGQAGLTRPSGDNPADTAAYSYACQDRLSAVAIIARCAMDYAGQQAFTNVLRNSAGSLRKELAKPLPYTPADPERETAAAVSR